MPLRMTLKSHVGSALLFTSLGIKVGWILWRRSWKKPRKLFNAQMNAAHGESIIPKWISEQDGYIEDVTGIHDIATPHPCVLYHPYGFGQTSESCTPNHWHKTYWLQYIAVFEQEPRHAIVQHTDTQRYHLMIQIPVEQNLPCDDCSAPHEVFRLPVQDHYAYFVFVPGQDLDGFVLLSRAQEAAQSRSISDDSHHLLPDRQIKTRVKMKYKTFRKRKVRHEA